MIVVDASVAIKWFLIEPETPQAVKIVEQILSKTNLFVVPELFYYEVFSVVIRKHQDPVLWANSGMIWLLNLPLQRVSMTAAISKEMHHWTARGLTGYDAAYIALAKLYDAKWLTYDQEAKRKLGNPSWIISVRTFSSRRSS